MKTTSKKKKKLISLKYIFTESIEKLNKAYDILFDETIKNKDKKHISNSERVLAPNEFNNLYDYYTIQYPKDLEIFKQACVYPNYCNDKENNIRNVGDLQLLQENNHYLLKKKHFIYFMAIHTAFLMTVFHYFGEKFEEFKLVNKGVIFEFGCTNIFMMPWGILERLDIHFDRKLFSDCLGLVISQMMTDNYFCGIIPRDFMDKFIDDPDLNNPKIPYGKHWKKIVKEEWFQATRCICPKK
jgi:hypothetical protein